MKGLRKILASAVAGTILATTGCAGYNIRMSSVMIDREGERDFLIGYGCLAKGGSYTEIGILNLAGDNHWYAKVIPIFNTHTATEAEEKEKKTTLQVGSVGYAEGSCFQLNYLTFRGNKNPFWKKFSPLIGWLKGEKEI